MPKILIVEDEIQIAKMYEFKLLHAGFEVMVAYDGIQGLEAAEKFKPDLIMLDLMMPIMTGGEMLRKLRAKDWGSNIKVIILTNISRDEAPSDLRVLGVERYIVKAHFTPTQVIEVVKEVLKS